MLGCQGLQRGIVQAQQQPLGTDTLNKTECRAHRRISSTRIDGRAVCTPTRLLLRRSGQQHTVTWRTGCVEIAARAPELACSVGDVIQATADDGSEVHLEVLAAGTGSELLLANKGVVWRSTVSSNQGSSTTALELQPQGWQLSPHDAVVKAFPGWSVALTAAQAAAALPMPMTVRAPAVVSSATRLEGAVQLDASLWCGGTAPNDLPLTGLQYQLLCAGEIASLLAGKRGVVMVQLQVGWDKLSPQPVVNPLALHMLRKALLRPDLSIFVSKAAGGLGLTAIMAAKVEPFRSWGLHMASFGAQAALTADSPYYKLLIGRVMGYNEANIIHHIQTTSGRDHPSPEVVSAVTINMAKLSKKKPQLPWTQQAQQQAQQQAGRRGARGKKSR